MPDPGCLVDHHHTAPGSDQLQGDRRADHPSTDHDSVRGPPHADTLRRTIGSDRRAVRIRCESSKQGQRPKVRHFRIRICRNHACPKVRLYRQSHARLGDRMYADERRSRRQSSTGRVLGAARLARVCHRLAAAVPFPQVGLNGFRRHLQFGEGCGAVPVHVRLGGRIASEYGITIRGPDPPQHLPFVKGLRAVLVSSVTRRARARFPGRKNRPLEGVPRRRLRILEKS